MFGSTALELAIGLIFIFTLVSLLVTALTELIASWLRWRAANLWKGLRTMLGESVHEQVYNHPLLKTLVTPTTGPPVGLAWLFRLPVLRRLWPTAKGPSYIPPRTFAFALLDLMEQPYQALDRLIDAVDAAAVDPSRISPVIALVKTLPAPPSMTAALSRLQPLVDELGEPRVSPERARAILLRIRNEAVTLSEHPALFDADVQGALRPLLAAAGGDENRIRSEIETWFNDMTDRTSGWYKRKTQAIQVVLGLMLAVWLDVDIVLISRVLWADSTLRSTLVAQAEAASEAPADAGGAPNDAQQRFDQLRGRVLALGLPLRGSCDAPPGTGGTEKPLPWWCSEIAGAMRTFEIPWVGPLALPIDPMRWLGWLLTAVAASLGAPFWFDTMKKVTSIRGAGRPPEEPAPAKDVPQPKPMVT